MDLKTLESSARSTAESRKCSLFLDDGIAAILVFLRHLITIQSLVSCLFSTGTTFLLYNFHADWESRGGSTEIGEDGEASSSASSKPSSYGKSMSFLILSFFLVMPITTLLRITYLRREAALRHICKMKACAMAIYSCHATWTWPYKDENQKRLNRLKHSDECLHLLVEFADTMTRFLTLPMTGYPRHREIEKGRGEEERTIAAAYALFETSVSEFGTKLGLLTERMKDYGFSPSEASRVRQSERMLLEAAEFLREAKLYRTPQSMNAVITFFSVFGPAFYAPAFAQIGYEFGSIWFGITYAAIVSISLTALYEAVRVMEDPFGCYITIDGINVFEELSIVYYMQLLRARETIFPTAPMFGGNEMMPNLGTLATVPKHVARHRRTPSDVSVYSDHRSSTRYSMATFEDNEITPNMGTLGTVPKHVARHHRTPSDVSVYSDHRSSTRYSMSTLSEKRASNRKSGFDSSRTSSVIAFDPNQLNMIFDHSDLNDDDVETGSKMSEKEVVFKHH